MNNYHRRKPTQPQTKFYLNKILPTSRNTEGKKSNSIDKLEVEKISIKTSSNTDDDIDVEVDKSNIYLMVSYCHGFGVTSCKYCKIKINPGEIMFKDTSAKNIRGNFHLYCAWDGDEYAISNTNELKHFFTLRKDDRDKIISFLSLKHIKQDEAFEVIISFYIKYNDKLILIFFPN
jgi:hypothetical protein